MTMRTRMKMNTVFWKGFISVYRYNGGNGPNLLGPLDRFFLYYCIRNCPQIVNNFI